MLVKVPFNDDEGCYKNFLLPPNSSNIDYLTTLRHDYHSSNELSQKWQTFIEKFFK